MVLFGFFNYTNRGILDWSHLRFFTRRTIRQIVEASGFRVTATHFTIIPLERLISVSPENRMLRLANTLLRAATGLLPGLFAYEIVLVAER
jgi:hypothetical protein